MHCFQSDPYRNGDVAMTHVAALPAVVLAAVTAVAPRRRRSRAQMKALDLFYPSAARDLCRGAIKAFRLATLSGTARIHRIRAVADKTVAKTTFWGYFNSCHHDFSWWTTRTRVARPRTASSDIVRPSQRPTIRSSRRR